MRLFLLTAVVLLALENAAHPQSLSEQLVSEDPVELAKLARERGDIVRGAILYHQGNIACAKCHRQIAGEKSVGPDLSKRKQSAQDSYYVESVLLPSKVLTEGYASVRVLTTDDRVLTGVIVDEDDDRIRMRDAKDVDKVYELEKSQIEQRSLVSVSAMPVGLADQLASRQQFLDLLRYVLELPERASGEDANIAAISNASETHRGQLSEKLQSMVDLQELNCIACHAHEPLREILSPKHPPKLFWSAVNRSQSFLTQFIANPQKLKSHSTMPQLMDSLSDSDRIEAANAIANFIVAEASKTEAQAARLPKQPDEESGVRGRQLFHSVGCVACHAPRDEIDGEVLIDSSVPLANLADRYSMAALVEFLKDPCAVRPAGRMPSLNLSHFEAVDLATYLLNGKGTVTAEQWKPESDLAAKGKQLFESLNCGSCHTDFASQAGLKVAKAPALGRVNPELGCLSNDDGAWPKFTLTEKQRAGIASTIKQLPSGLEPQEHVDVLLTAFRCTSCHQRGSLGGAEQERNSFFTTTNLNLGEQGRLPPTLTNVGAKLKSKWLRDVLVNHRSIRPYMNTRMPQFGEANVGQLVELFEAIDRLPTRFQSMDIRPSENRDPKTKRNEGLELVGSKGLNCVACHTFQFKKSDTMPAVDLTEMAERLKDDWFVHYMLHPQQFSPNTVMPSFWGGGKAIRRDLSGTPRTQLESIWEYLLDGRQARMPRGVVREPLEIVVNDEARMLRRSWPGIGKRGIGVGYPGGVNLAFDAEQMRLASVWKGKFADPAGVWMGQGSGRVRPMERTIDFAKGPDVDSNLSPWVPDDGRPPNHRFRGYELDAKQRPSFLYAVGNVEVSDYFRESEINGKAGLIRTVTLVSETQRTDLRLRVAENKKFEKIGENYFRIGDGLAIRLDSAISMVPMPGGEATDQTQLVVRFDLEPNKSLQLKLEYVWE